MLPPKKTRKWLWIFFLYTIIILVSLIITRLLLGSTLNVSYLLSLAAISFSTASIPCIAGYLGRSLFFKIYSAAAFLGILYAFYVVLGNTAPGWGDLTSLIGYLFIVLVGAILALVSELVLYLII